MSPSQNKDAMLPISFTDRRHEALVRFWWTSTLLKKVSRRFFRLHNSSEAHFNLLMVLKYAEEPLTQNEISQRLLVDKSNVTGLIDRLDAQDLIRRNKVPGDRRSYHITLTKRGRDVVENLNELYAEEVARIMSAFSGREIDALIRLTGKLHERLLEG